jgi:hypothetical protein
MSRLIREALNFIKELKEKGHSDGYIEAAYLSKQDRLSAYEFKQLLIEEEA